MYMVLIRCFHRRVTLCILIFDRTFVLKCKSIYTWIYYLVEPRFANSISSDVLLSNYKYLLIF